MIFARKRVCVYVIQNCCYVSRLSTEIYHSSIKAKSGRTGWRRAGSTPFELYIGARLELVWKRLKLEMCSAFSQFPMAMPAQAM